MSDLLILGFGILAGLLAVGVGYVVGYNQGTADQRYLSLVRGNMSHWHVAHRPPAVRRGGPVASEENPYG